MLEELSQVNRKLTLENSTESDREPSSQVDHSEKEESISVTADPTLTVVALIGFLFLLRTLSGG